MIWTQMGEFCDRPVSIGRLESVAATSALDSLSDSTVMVVLNAAVVPVRAHKALIQDLLTVQPLSLCLFGPDADPAFDTLLEVQAQFRSDVHTMTMNLAGEPIRESLESFVYASIPSEDRFDDWTHCRILVIGEHSDFESFHHEALRMLKG